MSKQIRKSDYYIGAFLYHIVKKVIRPAIIMDCSDSAKIIEFETNESAYNVFVKYSSKPKSKTPDAKRWDFVFTEGEISKLRSMLNGKGKNLVALVASEPSLTDTEIAVLNYDDANLCLGVDRKNKSRRITVVYNKHRRHLLCYGTALSDIKALKTERSLDKHFV